MGFSIALQGPAAHEALLARQDAELLLLENMRRCLALRIKCDREYSIALNAVVAQSGKFTSSKDITSSLIYKVSNDGIMCHSTSFLRETLSKMYLG